MLVSRLRALVRRSGRAADRILRVGTLRIDTATGQVSRNGTEIELSATERSLLEALAGRAGTVVSKQTLYDEVWSGDRDHRSNVIEVYIRYLRSKVDDPFGVKTIDTVRGQGYRLVADEAVDG